MEKTPVFKPKKFVLSPEILEVIGQKHPNLLKMEYKGVLIEFNEDPCHFMAHFTFSQEGDYDIARIQYFPSEQEVFYCSNEKNGFMTFKKGAYAVSSMSGGFSYYQLDEDGVFMEKNVDDIASYAV